MADTLAQVRVGPEHHGQRMSFWEFQRAHATPGWLYELARGVVEVTDVPGRIHALMLDEVELQLGLYRGNHPGVIKYAAGGSGAKVELPGIESERHPDRSLYLDSMPDDNYPWDKWTPSIVIEVVSPGADSRERDFVTKREEYLTAGVDEYWIFDPKDRVMLALQRHGDRWRETKLDDNGVWKTPRLPEFALNLAPIFAVLDRPGAK